MHTIFGIDGHEGAQAPGSQAVLGAVFVDVDAVTVDGEHLGVHVYLPEEFTVITSEGHHLTSTGGLHIYREDEIQKKAQTLNSPRYVSSVGNIS